MDHIFDINRLCREAGENKVDIRNVYVQIAAIQEGILHLLFDDSTGELIGCVSIYTFDDGDRQFNEIGTLVLLPAYRGLGIADFIVTLSCLHIMLADPGSICVSELYEDSVKAKTVLERIGFRQIVPCEFRRARADAPPSRAVIHMELGDGPVPVMASHLLVWMERGMIIRSGMKVRFLFGDGYWLNTEAGREVLRRLSLGDLSPVRKDGDEDSPIAPHGGPPPPPKPPRGRGNRPH
jgi:N-acetylglutamate synthase-like GNAT family acetyltransferase